MVYFYARVSTKDQNLDRQIQIAHNYKKADRIFADKQTGRTFDRPQYQMMKEVLKAGDEVIIKSLDRLGRNKEATKDEIKWFKDNGVTLRILNLPTSLIDFEGQEWIADMVNNIMIEVLSSYAQQEWEEIKQRQKEGIRIHLEKGLPYGRPKADVDMHRLKRLYIKQQSGIITVDDAIKDLDISRTLWYNLTKTVNQNNETKQFNIRYE